VCLSMQIVFYCIGHLAFNEELNSGIEFFTYDREGENETSIDLERYDLVCLCAWTCMCVCVCVYMCVRVYTCSYSMVVLF